MGRIHDAVFNPQPRAPKGYRYRKTTSGEWRLVCDMCGSNCGQCGDTARHGDQGGSAHARATSEGAGHA